MPALVVLCIIGAICGAILGACLAAEYADRRLAKTEGKYTVEDSLGHRWEHCSKPEMFPEGASFTTSDGRDVYVTGWNYVEEEVLP